MDYDTALKVIAQYFVQNAIEGRREILEGVTPDEDSLPVNDSGAIYAMVMDTVNEILYEDVENAISDEIDQLVVDGALVVSEE